MKMRFLRVVLTIPLLAVSYEHATAQKSVASFCQERKLRCNKVCPGSRFDNGDCKGQCERMTQSCLNTGCFPWGSGPVCMRR
jgi:hypothetical protein